MALYDKYLPTNESNLEYQTHHYLMAHPFVGIDHGPQAQAVVA